MFGCSSSGQQAESLNFWVFRALRKGEGRLQVDSEVLYSVTCRHVRTVTCMFFLGGEPNTYENSDDVRPHICRTDSPQQQWRELQSCPASEWERHCPRAMWHKLVQRSQVRTMVALGQPPWIKSQEQTQHPFPHRPLRTPKQRFLWNSVLVTAAVESQIPTAVCGSDRSSRVLLPFT